jgi:UMF1 family MFS transporter
LLLAINAAWIISPETFGFRDSGHAARASFVSAAIWWALFAIPLFRRVREPRGRLEAGESPRMNPVRVGLSRVVETFGEIRERRQVFIFLLAFWCYNDGIGTIIKMATVYGAEIGIGASHLIGALLVVQLVGVPSTFAFGALARRIGAKRGLYLALAVYVLITILGYFMTHPIHFWLLAVLVATVQGGSQALSRSLYASMVPKRKSSEFFGFYSVSAKFAGIVGPFIFAVVGQLTGDSRLGILALLPFFIIGMVLLAKVDEGEGRRIARAEDPTLIPAAREADRNGPEAS